MSEQLMEGKQMDRHGEESLMIELFLLVALILLVPCVVVSGCIGKTYGRNDIKKQAVQAGVAKWTVDKDGVVEFQWIKETEKSE